MAETDGLVLPVGLTEKQLLQQVARIESRMAKMEAASTKSFVRANAKIAQSFKGIETAASGMSGSTKAALANMGFQVQDIITQVSGGTSLTRALSQQLPQLLGGLGLVGIAAGTLAPLFIGIGAAMFGATNDAKAAEEQMKSLAKALGELQTATNAAQQSRFDLIEQFGPEQVGQARQMLEIQRELARVNLARELSAAADMIGKAQLGDFVAKSADEWEEFGRTLASVNGDVQAFAEMAVPKGGDELFRATDIRNAANEAAALVDELSIIGEMFGATTEESAKLLASIIRLRDAEGPRDQAAAAAELRDRLSEVMGNMDGANEEALKLVEQLLNVEDAALRAAAADIAGAITPAADEAKRLADELGRAVTNAMNLAVQGISSLRQAQINYDFRDDPVGRAAVLAREQFDSTTKLPIDKETGLPIEAPPEVTAQIEAQRRAFVGAAVATEEYRQRLIEWRKEEAAAARAGKSGSKGRANAYETALTNLIGGTDAARQQIAAINEITGAGRDLGRELQIIAERQKVLNAAQKAGIEITPEMTAQIDALVAEYVDANDQLKDMKDNAKRGEDALSDFFGSILEGADAAKQALASLLLEIAKAQFSKGMMGLLGLTSWGSGLVGLIGSGIGANAAGTTSWRGGLTQINELGGEIVDLPTGTRIIPHDVSMRMAEKTASADAGATSIGISVDVTGARGNAEIQEMVAAGVAQGLQAYDKKLPSRVQKINARPRER